MRRARPDEGYHLVSRDPLFTQGFTQVPIAVLDSPRLTPGPKCLYALLLRYAWQKKQTFVSQRRLSRQCGVTDRTIRRWMGELIAMGLARVHRPEPHRTNTYLLQDGSPAVLASLGVLERDEPTVSTSVDDWPDPFAEESP
jgi:hypothetical protein